jgi:hypothetical protein
MREMGGSVQLASRERPAFKVSSLQGSRDGGRLMSSFEALHLETSETLPLRRLPV